MKYKIYDIDRDILLGKVFKKPKKYFIYKSSIKELDKNIFNTLYKKEQIINKVVFVKLSNYNELKEGLRNDN